MKNRFYLITVAILSVGLFLTANIGAQDGPPAQTPAQAQGPTGVGRLSVINGDVSTMHGDAGSWVAGTVNTPVVPGDKVATADRSRAEVQIDSSNVMRLDQRTEAKVADLEQNKIQIQLASGLVDFSVLNGTQADAEIDTPNMGVHPLAPGVYRIQVNSPSETLLIVRQGEAEVLTDEGNTKVEAGQIIQIHGSDNPEYKIDPAPGGDDFDNWCSNRDRQIQSAQAWQHTGPDYTGSNDLDAYGQWSEVPDYGWCWTPQVDAGWVPYSAGNWGWEPYWGWTWISYEPWGWAPYHYGRWFMYGGSWRWWPARGFYGPHAMWAPAYVSFFGFGGRGFGAGVGFGFGSIGWLALGPRDVFHPWFGPGHRFGAMGFNDMHGAGFIHPGGPRFGSNLETMMTDAHVRSALRNVSAQAFASGRGVRSMPVSESMLHNASMMRGALPVAHTQASLGRASNFSSNRSAAANGQHFFSSRGATPAGRTGGNTEGFGTRSNSLANGRTEASQPRAGGQTYNWRRYSTSGQSPAANGSGAGFQGRGAPTAQGTQHNWQRFASPSPYSGRTGSGATSQRGGWQGYSSPSRNYSGGYGSRPPLQLNRPIMRQRAPGSGYYGGGGRSYSAPSSGSRSKSAPSGGSGHSSSAPKSGGGGGHSSGGGGGHSSGGGHSGGHR